MFFNILLAAAVGVVSHVGSEYLQPVNNNGTGNFSLSTLKFVSLVARHGSRSPLSTFPKDCCPYYDLRYWPDGVGRLTKVGKIQAYTLGEQLRSRYDGFINAQYYDNDTIFQSNAYDRDLASAELMATGMYPPIGFQIWNTSIQWQPIAVWITDYDVSDTEDDCPRYEQEREEILNDLYLTMSKQYNDLFTKVANNTGLKESEVWAKISSIYQDAILLSENGLPKMEWLDTETMNKLFAVVSYKYQQEVGGTETMRQLIAGPVLESLTDQFNAKTNGTLNPDRKMYVLAAHDTTIVALVGGLGINELLIPDPASSLVFEIHKSDSGYIVQILYFNHSSTATPTLFEIPGCSHPCPLSNFTQVAQRTIENSSRDNCVAASSASISIVSSVLVLILAFLSTM